MWLNEKDRNYLNSIYTKAYKKYFGWTVTTPNGEPLTYAQALETARDELEEYYATRRVEINAKYDARVLSINTEANKRGLLTSTVVLQQLERAATEREIALSKFETVTDAKVRISARKMMADNLSITRLSVKADQDTLNLIVKETAMGGVPQADRQKAMDEEVYVEYLTFLLKLSPDVALSYLDDDPLFYYNLSEVYFNKLMAEMEKRGWRT